MKVDKDLILELRLERTWSQDELGIACGLNRRTIQRIEKDATASLQSIKAIASALEVDVNDLRIEESKPMKTFEYKTIEMAFKFGLLKRGIPDIDTTLNAEAETGWRLHSIIPTASSSFGESNRIIAVMEREKPAEA